MKIYVSHSTKFNFKKELYYPLKKSILNDKHIFIFPHDFSLKQFDSKKLFEDGCDLVLAELSYPSIGVGIELGWANMKKIRIILLCKVDAKFSSSLKVISKEIIYYQNTKDLIKKLIEYLK